MSYYTTVHYHPNDVYSVYPNLTTIPHYHHVDTVVYHQPEYIDLHPLEFVHRFPVHEFVHLHSLTPVYDHVDYYSKEIPYFKSDTDLDEEHRKTCRCYVHVQEKNKCDKSGWGRRRGCYNPYAVCNRNLPAVHNCSEYYDFDDFSDSELEGYIRAHGIYPKSESRTDMMDAINAKFM